MSQKNPKRKITFIGAGSTVFAKNLLGDILSFPELADSSICLYDIDRERLATSERVGQRIGNAAMLDPHTAAELDLDQIWQLVDELLFEHGDWIPRQFHKRQR
jgi:alpha-galactosidase/6-phospho-beta-glucosidase family protein